MYNILTLADYVIDHVAGNGVSISHLKLQKLLYYLKVWSLVADQPLMKAGFNKWKYGPVNSTVYRHYKVHGSQQLQPTKPGNNPFKSAKDKVLVDFILDSYCPYDALTLSTFTHRELPWLMTEESGKISDETIIDYYSELEFAKNFPLSEESDIYIPVYTEQDASFIFDMELAFAQHVFKYNSIEDFKSNIDKAKKPALKFLKDAIAAFA